MKLKKCHFSLLQNILTVMKNILFVEMFNECLIKIAYFALKIRKQRVYPTGICDEGAGLVAVFKVKHFCILYI